MSATITAPAYRIIPIVPALKPGAMEGDGPFVASEKIQEALGFPGKLVDDWHDQAICQDGRAARQIPFAHGVYG